MTREPRIRLEYLTADREPPVRDEDLSGYELFRCEVEGDNIYGELLYPDAGFPKPRPCVIMWHGFPGGTRNDDIAHALCRVGCVVIVPHHRGAWGSEGKYLLTNCVKDAVAVAELCRDPAYAEPRGIDPECIFFFGHSMGSCVSLNAAKQLPWIRGLVLMAPYDPTLFYDEDPDSHFAWLMNAGALLHSDGPAAVGRDIGTHLDSLSFASCAEAVADRNLLVITGDADYLAPPAKIVDPFWERILELDETAKCSGSKEKPIHRRVSFRAGHGLIGVRIGLIEAIARYLKEVAE